MKRILITTTIFIVFAIINSCSKTDDYAAPSETLTGSVIDSVTGQPIRTEQPDGIRLRMLETSWSDNPVPWYFWVKEDGTFNNSKVFRATYQIAPVDGPFFPIEEQTVEVKGATTINFTVVPFLNVDFIGKPSLQDTVVSLSYKIARPREAFKIKDVRVFVSNTPYVSNGSFDNNLSSPVMDLNGVDDTAILDSLFTATITKLRHGRTYYIRVGARTNDNVSQRYNYSEVQSVEIP